ncbi:MAG: family 16 glycosylhydrolase [Verrucomicrobiota bacterium]|nr:family 16 glycosylhydrolase [Verrucomicrobiota bacterium]
MPGDSIGLLTPDNRVFPVYMGRYRLLTLCTVLFALTCGSLAQPASAQTPPAPAASEDASRPFLGFWKIDESAGDTAYINIKPRGRASVFWTGMSSDKIESGTYVMDGAKLVITWTTGFQEVLEQPSTNVIIRKTFPLGASLSGTPTLEARGERLDSRVPGSLTVPPTGPRLNPATIAAGEVNASALRSPYIGYWEVRQGTGSVLGIGGGSEFFFLNLQRAGKAQAVQRNSWDDSISKQVGSWTVEGEQAHILWPSGHKDVLTKKADGTYELIAFNEKQSSSNTLPVRQVDASGAQALFTAGETRLFTIEDFVGYWRFDDRKPDTRPHLEIERWGTASRFADPNNPSQSRETGEWKITQSGIAVTWASGVVDLMEVSPTGYMQKTFAAGTSLASAPANSARVRRISRNEVATAIAAGEARNRAAEVTKRQSEAEERLKAQADARRKAEEDAKRLAAEEQHQRELAEAQRVAAENAEKQRIADAEAAKIAQTEAARLAKAEAEARVQAEAAAAARAKAEEESRRLAAAEEAANRRAAEQAEARQKAEAEAARVAQLEKEQMLAEEARLAAEASAKAATSSGVEKPATDITSTEKPAAVVVSEAQKQAEQEEAARKAAAEAALAQRKADEAARKAAADAELAERKAAEAARIAAEEARVRAEAELAAKQRAEADRRREEAIAQEKKSKQEAEEQSRQRALAEADSKRKQEAEALRNAEVAKAREAEAAARAKAAEQGRQRVVAEQAAKPPQFVGLQPTAAKAPLMNDLVWNLVWEERFNGTSLDPDRWNVGYPSKNVANNELSGYAEDNIRIKDGALVVTARDKAIDYGGRNQPYTSGVITTFGKFEQAYGYFETRVRVTEGKGLWPNFWLFSKGAAAIRVLDIFGNEPDKTYHTVVAEDSTGTPKQRGFQRKGVDFSWEYHVVGVMWTPSAITFHVDGEEIGRLTDNIPAEPMSIVLSMAVGGDLVGPPDGWTPFPAYYWVDWVRVYKLSE